MLGDERRILEIERRLELMARENDALRRRLTAAEQLARQGWGQRPQSGGGATGRVCVAVGDIPPRVGTTAGAGQADLVAIDPDTGAITTGDRIDARNPSVSTMATGVGIKAGLYCWAEKDAGGTWVIAPLECG